MPRRQLGAGEEGEEGGGGEGREAQPAELVAEGEEEAAAEGGASLGRAPRQLQVPTGTRPRATKMLNGSRTSNVLSAK